MAWNKLIPVLLLKLACWSIPLKAQVQHGGEPLGPTMEDGRIPFIEMPNVDESELLRQDSIARGAGRDPFRFATNHQVDIDVRKDGRVDTLSDGKLLFRIGVRSEGARSLGFGFAPYELVQGAELYIYRPDGREVLGSFTEAEAVHDSILPTIPIRGDEAIIELIEPRDAPALSELGIERVSHAYRSLSELADKGEREYGDAGDCHMNVNCPDGRPYRRQKRAVAMLISNGNRICSGVLMNNTSEDGTPYFLTADHCLEQPGSPPNWTFIFDYEAPDCPDRQGSLDKSIAGADLRAQHEDSDFALVELVDTPPGSYGVYYAGWDHSGTTPDSTLSIHHPKGDIKKISFDDDPPSSGQFGNSIPNGEWHIEEWDRNTTTEAASSGGPLFDPEGRVIGQLHGGQAECGNSVNDHYGKFSVSWDHHAANDSQLKHWLDPLDTNVKRWNGYDPRVGDHPYDAALTDILAPEELLCRETEFEARVEFQNRGSKELNSLDLYLALDGDTLKWTDWSGSLASGDYDTASFSTASIPEGSLSRMLVGSEVPNGQNDLDPSDDTSSMDLEHRADGRRVRVELMTDCYGTETGWYVRKENGDTLDGRSPGFYPGTESSPEDSGSRWTHRLCLNEGCYELLLYDSYGDGIQGSQYGGCEVDGDLKIRGEEGELLAELGDPGFGEDTVLTFCTGSNIDNKIPDGEELTLFPNPNSGSFRLQFDGIEGRYDLRIHDLRGRTIFSRRIEKGRGPFGGEIELPNVRAGSIYLLELEGPTETYIEKLFIDR